MKTRARIVSSGLVLVAFLALALFWDEAAVGVCRLLKGGGIPAETGQRIRYVKCLSYCGTAGRKETRAFVQKWWSSPQPSRYAAGLLVQARHAYIGVPVDQLVEALGTPAKTTTDTVVYLTHTGDVGRAMSVVFRVQDDRVTDVLVLHE